MNKKLVWILFFGIIILASVLRLWKLGDIPPSPDWDEVAIGYDAYSIIHTGRDQFDKFLPVVLRSFDDYKPALYAYLTIPAILVFDLSVFTVRFPSALMGIISVLAVFYLIRELFENYRYKDHLSLLGAFLLAVSPWSIQFSRVGFESNVGDAFNILMVLFFLKGLKKSWYLYLSILFAGLNIYVYQSEKVFTPLLFLALVIIHRKNIFALSRKYLLSIIILGLIVIAPMVFYIVGNRAALLRVTGTSIFSYQTELLKTNTQKLQQDIDNKDKIGSLIDNRRIVYAYTIASGYISHFDFNWLFISGDISRHHAPGVGLLYLFEFPFILIGIYQLIFGNFDRKTKLTIFAWFLLAPLPASITTGVPHAVRTLNFLPIYQIFSALGILFTYIFINRYKKIRLLFYLLFITVFILNFSYYLDQYFVQLNYYTSQDWQYGYRQAVDEVKLLQDRYKQIIISDKQPMDKSYMFFLFYLKYPPSDYQKIGRISSGSFAAHQAFGRYVFRQIDWQRDSLIKNSLYVGNPGEIPAGVNVIKTIYNLDGTPAIIIAGT